MRLLRSLSGLVLSAALSATVLAPSAPARAELVDLELILAVDVSGSIDEVEAHLQRQGYLKALVHSQVIRAITSGERQRVAITYIEWAGSHFQRVVVDWTVISDAASARAFAAKIAENALITERWTSISAGIDFAMTRFAASPHKGTRRVIDISGDGPNNSGRSVQAARDAAVAKGITINGLPIVNDRPNPWGMPPPRDLDKYYFRNVIGGPGAFIIVARGFEAFARAIRSKLVREIAGTSGPEPAGAWLDRNAPPR